MSAKVVVINGNTKSQHTILDTVCDAVIFYRLIIIH